MSFALCPSQSLRALCRGRGHRRPRLDGVAGCPAGQLAPAIDMSDDPAFLGSESHAVPAHAPDIRNVHDKRGFLPWLNRREIEGGFAAREIVTVAIEQVDDGDHMTRDEAIHRILNEPRHGEGAIGIDRVPERQQFDGWRAGQRRR